MHVDIDAIYQWIVANNMIINGDKFELVQFTTSGEAMEYEYQDPEEVSIQSKSEVRDHVVVMSDTDRFNI